MPLTATEVTKTTDVLSCKSESVSMNSVTHMVLYRSGRGWHDATM